MNTEAAQSGARSDAYGASLESLTLTELQDVIGHLDRDAYPERIEAVRKQIQVRLAQLETVAERGQEVALSASAFRRVWGSLLDVFVSLFPFVIYMGAKLLAASSGASGGGGGGGRGRGGGGRGRGQAAEASFLDQILDYITSPEAVWSTIVTYGPWIAGFMLYRALFTLPQLKRSGALPGMREAGVRLESTDGGPLRWRQLSIRFVLSYVLGLLTLGVSHLWALWDREGRTVFDRISGTRAIRAARRWEKTPEDQLLED